MFFISRNAIFLFMKMSFNAPPSINHIHNAINSYDNTIFMDYPEMHILKNMDSNFKTQTL